MLFKWVHAYSLHKASLPSWSLDRLLAWDCWSSLQHQEHLIFLSDRQLHKVLNLTEEWGNITWLSIGTRGIENFLMPILLYGTVPNTKQCKYLCLVLRMDLNIEYVFNCYTLPVHFSFVSNITEMLLLSTCSHSTEHAWVSQQDKVKQSNYAWRQLLSSQAASGGIRTHNTLHIRHKSVTRAAQLGRPNL